MKLSWRNVAFVIGVILVVGLIPDTLNLQSARNEHLSLPAPDIRDELPPSAISELPTAVPAPTKIAFEEIPTREPRIIPRETPTPKAFAYETLDLYLHLPPDAAKRQPLRVLIVLHGVGNRGDVFSQSLIAEADRNYWLLVAPTFAYRDWMDPASLLREDIAFSGLLADMLDNLPKKLGIKLHRHALVYGFSRGAQLAHRFSLLYPEHVEAVAAMSAGAYTLPLERKNNEVAAPLLLMPYGVGDIEKYVGHALVRDELKQVSYFIAVGGNDNEPDEVPRQFDAYVGKNRVARAYAFQSALLLAGVPARLMIFPGAGHEITSEMRLAALQFLRAEELAKKLTD